MEISDAAVVAQVLAGDKEAFRLLVERHTRSIYSVAYRMTGNQQDAEEILQETFLRAYRSLARFELRSSFATWLYRLTVNAALSRLRRRKRRPEIAIDDYLPQFREDGHHLVRPVVDWSSDLEQGLANAQMQQLLWQAIELLQPLDKAVLVLSDFEELPNQEIGEALGLTVPAVKARLHRARLFLRGQLAVALGHSPT